MRIYEKILVGLVVLFFGLLFFPDFTGMAELFPFVTLILGLSYLFGGYWLLNLKKNTDGNKHYFLMIFAGVAFATSLYVLPYRIRILTDPIYKILPLINAGLFLGLSTYLLIKRNEIGIYKGIFIRSAIILAVVGFFAYSPGTFVPYRYVLIALNTNGYEELVSNLQMFGYIDEYEDAMDNGDCVLAIEYAEKANEAGLAWLGIPTQKDMRVEAAYQNRLSYISGTYSFLYRAYKCKADEYFNNDIYEKAVIYYIKADKALNACDQKYETWNDELAYSLNKIAICYLKLNNYKYADSLFVEAINKYQIVKPTPDRNIAVFYRNLAESMANQLQFGYSNLLYKASNTILESDSTHEENKKEIIQNYFRLVENHLAADSLQQASFYIDEVFKRINKDSLDFCIASLYDGFCHYKLSNYNRADEVLTGCLDCYKKRIEATYQAIAENHLALALVKIALAEYDDAKRNLDTGIEITIKNFGKNGYRNANYLRVYAHLAKILGNYKVSEQKYHKVLETYINEFGERNQRLPEVLSGLADLEIDIAKFELAKAHSDSSLSIANSFNLLESPATTVIVNNAGYVNYYIGLYDVSESLFRKTLKISKDKNFQSAEPTAIALNGLGLVMTAIGKYNTADSLFAQTLKLHKDIFKENHPLTAVVYLNYANLKAEEFKLKEAKELLAKSLNINKNFFDQGHDIFADIYFAYGKIAEKEKLNNHAQGYFQKALEIYLGKFDEGHFRVKLTREKLFHLKTHKLPFSLEEKGLGDEVQNSPIM